MVEKSLRPKLRPKNLGKKNNSSAPKTSLRPVLRPKPKQKPTGNIFTYDEDIKGITTEGGKPLQIKKSYVRGKNFEIPMTALKGLISRANKQGGFSGTVKQILEFIQNNNPTRKQMEKFLMTTSASKGKLITKKKPKPYKK